jgi:alpha-amylase
VADNSADEEVWVSVGDPNWYNQDLIDYSGAHGLTKTRVYADGRVLIKTSPAGHTIPGAKGHGYSIWAPIPSGFNFTTVTDLYNYLSAYSPARSATTVQEWEMANDLGDSHTSSLQQGGMLPNLSAAQRNVGRIFVAANQAITYKVFPAVNGTSQNIALYNTSGAIVSQATGVSSNTAPLTGTYTPTADGWIAIRVKHANTTTAAQKVWVNISYVAPKVVNTRTSPGNLRTTPFVFSEQNQNQEPSLVSLFPNPSNGYVYFELQNISSNDFVNCRLFDLKGQKLIDLNAAAADLESSFNSSFNSLEAGFYLVQLNSGTFNQTIKLLKQ